MTLNDLLALQGATYDPNAYFDPQAGGGAWMPQVGPGWMTGLPAEFADTSNDGGTIFNRNAFNDWLRSNNYTAAEGFPEQNAFVRGIFDQSGNPVLPLERGTYEDDAFWNAGMAAMALTGANIGLANGLFGGAAAGGGGIGTLGGAASLPSVGAAVPGMSTAGLGALSAPSLGGGAAAAGGLGSFLTSPGFLGPAINAGIGLLGQNQAINAQQDANNQNIAFQREVLAQQRADNQPLLDLRNSTIPRINALMQDPSSITSDPGYQFGLNQGNKLIGDRQAASGNYYSGAAMKELNRFGQDYGGTKLNESLNRLMGVAGLGQVGGNNNQQATGTFGQNTTQLINNAGNIRGSGYMGMTNNLGGMTNEWFNNWQRQNGGG